ncbi:MAG: helix-turn-helix transcriptional regulator, partial [Bacteroidales bacterium]|nr:helix-turn-helix transcriptional regulator [Bacteroidales bacterium]
MIDRINLILKAKNLTAKQFAEEIGIQPSGMSHILSGRNNPSLDFVMKVMRRYPEINLQWLLNAEGEMYKLETS